MNTYIFYLENNDEGFSFEIEAENEEEAYEKAFDEYGPIIEDMHYKIQNTED